MLSFAETSQQWTYKTTDLKPNRDATSSFVTKGNDGPNEYSIIVGRVVAGYLMGEFVDTAGFMSVYGLPTATTLGPNLVRSIKELVNHLDSHPIVSLYYNSYKVPANHRERLIVLVSLLEIMTLEIRMNDIMDRMEGQLSNTTTAEQERELDRRLQNLLKL
jgi:hypothetical protein